jgi:hypothetical protein
MGVYGAIYIDENFTCHRGHHMLQEENKDGFKALLNSMF